ncbi:porin [Capnocytophaga gingivalis]|uniref:porin n=1 Tax=Capnocytophaga gingivalis TaxID=1017 RepID=UPI0028ED1EE3|nr:porin [Capnocytophaga gingivalis]
MRKHLLFIFFLVSFFSFARVSHTEETDTLSAPSSAQKLLFNFYINSNFSAEKHTHIPSSAAFRIEDARLNLQGSYDDNLSYRIRMRLNRPFTPTSSDNASVGLDFAFLTYTFGKEHQWEMRIGRAYGMIGSYELDINPLYEYIFSDHLNYVVNGFVTVLQGGYRINDQHQIGIQGHNTLNESFGTHLANNGFVPGDFKASKTPLGVYLYWMGTFFENKLHTYYSYDFSQFVQGYYTHSISLGNQLTMGNHSAYLDLIYSHMGADYALLGSKTLNQFEQVVPANYTMRKNMVYKGLISRYQYQFTDHWSIAAKVGVEFSGNQNILSEHHRTNYIYSCAGQYEPLRTEDFRFYVAYIGNTIDYKKELNIPLEQLHRVALGMAYTLPLYKK